LDDVRNRLRSFLKVKTIFGLFILLLSVALPATSFAAPSTSIMSAEEQAAMQKPWDFSTSLGHFESLYNRNDGSRISANTLNTTLGYKFNKDYKLTGEVDLVQDTLDSENNDISGASLALAHSKISVADRLLDLTPSLSSSIPVSQFDHHTSLQTSFGMALKTEINPEFLFSKRLSLALSLAGTRNFHTYSEGQDGTPNTEYVAVQDLKIGWEFTSWLSFAFDVANIDLWSYNGILSEFYAHSEEFDFTINKQWSVALGQCYGNPLSPFVPVWQADQQNYNFSLIDQRYSTVYGSVTLTY